MKKILSLIIASLCLLGLCSNYAFAANPYEDLEDTACSVAGFEDDAICERQGGNEESEAMGKVGTTLNVIYGLVGVIAVVFVVIGGFKFTTSQGDPGRVQQAKNTIMFSLIGLVVVIGAFAITSFVINAFGGAGGGSGGSDGVVASLEITSGDSLEVGKTLQIKIKFTPDYLADKSLTFKSSNTGVATINETGLITAVSEGKTKITATAKGGANASITIKVTGPKTVKGIKLDSYSITLKPEESKTIKATIVPETASEAKITWKIGDSSIATIDQNGKVTGVKEGQTLASATAGDVTVNATVKVSKSAGTGEDPGPTQPPAGGTEKYDAVFEKRTYDTMDYWFNVPEGATDNMALVVFLHGDGEMGNVNAVKNLKPTQYIHTSKDFIGIAPVGKRNSSGVGDWSSSKVQERVKGLIDQVVKDYKINTSRIYIWGFSRGAIGTWEMVSRYGSFFKAAVPVSCCGTVKTENYKSTKVYALAGSKESNYVSCMQSKVNAINSAGGSAQFKAVQGQSHSTITANFPYDEVIRDWLLKQ